MYFPAKHLHVITIPPQSPQLLPRISKLYLRVFIPRKPASKPNMRLSHPLSFLLASLTLALAAPAPLQNFVNTAIARTIELGGATTSTTTQYNVKAKDDSPGLYHLALANVGEGAPAWWEVQVGGKVVEGLIPLLVSGLAYYCFSQLELMGLEHRLWWSRWEISRKGERRPYRLIRYRHMLVKLYRKRLLRRKRSICYGNLNLHMLRVSTRQMLSASRYGR